MRKIVQDAVATSVARYVKLLNPEEETRLSGSEEFDLALRILNDLYELGGFEASYAFVNQLGAIDAADELGSSYAHVPHMKLIELLAGKGDVVHARQEATRFEENPTDFSQHAAFDYIEIARAIPTAEQIDFAVQKANAMPEGSDKVEALVLIARCFQHHPSFRTAVEIAERMEKKKDFFGAVAYLKLAEIAPDKDFCLRADRIANGLEGYEQKHVFKGIALLLNRMDAERAKAVERRLSTHAREYLQRDRREHDRNLS